MVSAIDARMHELSFTVFTDYRRTIILCRGHAASGEGQDSRARQRAPMQRLLFPLSGRPEEQSAVVG
jgi:hypothetical protein